MPTFYDDDLDDCDAEQAPAWCDQFGYSHLCDRPDGHGGTHECACGRRWTEPDQ